MRSRPIILAAIAAAIATTAAGAGAAGAPRASTKLVESFESLRGQTLSIHDGLEDLDRRTTRLAPSDAARAEVGRLGRGVSVRWNLFGTPGTLINHDGYLTTGLKGAPAVAARQWIRDRRAMFGLTDADVTNLELVNDAQFAQSPARAVLFRQRFDGLMAAQDGMITVGIRDGRIAIVTSSAIPHGKLTGRAVLSPAQAWLNAAREVGHTKLKLANVVSTGVELSGFNTFRVPGFHQPQRSRLVAFGTRDEGVRPAFETIVLNVDGGHAEAYKSYVDAIDGRVWWRQDAEQQHADTDDTYGGSSTSSAPPRVPSGGAFQGAYKEAPDKPACGPLHTFPVGPDVRAIVVVAHAVVPANDIVVNLIYKGTIVSTQDTGTSPEPLAYTPSAGVPAGNYAAQVCPFAGGAVTPPYDYVGTYNTYDGPLPAAYSDPAKWKYFRSTPPLTGNTDTRIVGCWDTRLNPSTSKNITDCKASLNNLAARAPWDFDEKLDQPTNTTKGNAASAGQAWISPLTPAEQYRPVSPSRDYIYPWTNKWRVSTTPGQAGVGCSPEAFTSPERIDIDAATTNLFVTHNQMHDFSYFLGFTERNYNAQQHNFGITAPQFENDPETGNAQAGAATGGAPSYLGRDNANQITLNDGIPPITNMYLWQPVVGFYTDCVDGDYDMAVIAHEYTHLISNRMVGGPDANLSGHQAGSMGEAWSDLVGIEYLNAIGFAGSTGEDPYALGAYVTGSKDNGIRNYNASRNPLNYSDVGYDTSGPQVHADGEIWSGTLFNVRRLLIAKYNKQFPAKSQTLQTACARNVRSFDLCPGNRRWIQNVFDSWLLMQPGVSMLDSRDAMMGADRLRTGGKNLTTMWQGFAQFGMGIGAKSKDAADHNPTPSFASPRVRNAEITFRLVDSVTGQPVAGEIYVGKYEARATPAATTDPDMPPGPKAKLVAGSYELLIRANGYGHTRLRQAVKAGEKRTITYRIARNLASRHSGAVASGTDGLYRGDLIDDTEGTNWVFNGAATQSIQGNTAPDPTKTNEPIKGKSVTVQLGGGLTKVDRIQVSGMHRPVRTGGETADPPQGRFTAIRQFAIDASTDGTNFREVYVSSPDAFPGKKPRPAAPQQQLRTFKMPKPFNATHVRIRVLTNHCTGFKGFIGDQDADPNNNSDCLASANAYRTNIAELQVFGTQARRGGAARPRAASRPAAAIAPAAPATSQRSDSHTATALAALAALTLAGTAAGVAMHRRA